MSIDSILDHLAYTSYATNRDAGVKHETLVKWGIGNDGFKEKYSNAAGASTGTHHMQDPREGQPEGQEEATQQPATETQPETPPAQEQEG